MANGESTQALLHLLVDCSSGNVCDYRNTSTFNLLLPSDVQFTSDSGGI